LKFHLPSKKQHVVTVFRLDFKLTLLSLQINDRYEFPLQLDLDREDGRYLSPDADKSVRNLYTLHRFLFIYCISAFVISYTVDSDRAIQIWSDVSEISSFLIGSSSQESGYRSLSFPKQMDSSFPFVIVKDKMNYVSVIFCAALLACLNILLLISMQCLGSQWRSAWRALLCFY